MHPGRLLRRTVAVQTALRAAREKLVPELNLALVGRVLDAIFARGEDLSTGDGMWRVLLDAWLADAECDAVLTRAATPAERAATLADPWFPRPVCTVPNVVQYDLKYVYPGYT